MSKKKWVRKSLSSLAYALSQQDYPVDRTTIRRMLRKLDYDLYHNRQSLTGSPHPDRDRQFRYINRMKNLFLATGYPVLSVDTKKKELIGNFRNNGVAWGLQATLVNAHDFKQDGLGRAVPYGIYDLAHNEGYDLRRYILRHFGICRLRHCSMVARPSPLSIFRRRQIANPLRCWRQQQLSLLAVETADSRAIGRSVWY